MEESIKVRLHEIFKFITIEECQLILGLDKNISEMIVGAYSKFEIRSFEDLEFLLFIPRIGFESLVSKINPLNDFQLSYLNLKNSSSREEIQYNLMLLFKDLYL